MFQKIVKPIIMGILLGLVLFIMPFFLLSALLLFFIAGMLFKLFVIRKFRNGFAHKVQAYGHYGFSNYKKPSHGTVINIDIK